MHNTSTSQPAARTRPHRRPLAVDGRNFPTICALTPIRTRKLYLHWLQCGHVISTEHPVNWRTGKVLPSRVEKCASNCIKHHAGNDGWFSAPVFGGSFICPHADCVAKQPGGDLKLIPETPNMRWCELCEYVDSDDDVVAEGDTGDEDGVEDGFADARRLLGISEVSAVRERAGSRSSPKRRVPSMQAVREGAARLRLYVPPPPPSKPAKARRSEYASYRDPNRMPSPDPASDGGNAPPRKRQRLPEKASR